MEIDISRFRDTFFEEAAEHVTVMEQRLLTLDSADAEAINEVFRCAHSIKGSSGSFGFGDVARFTHAVENLLDLLREGRIAVSPALVDLLLRATDTIKTLLDAARQNVPPPDTDDLRTAIERAAGAGEPSAAAVEAARPAAAGVEHEYHITFRPADDMFHHGMDPLLLLRELASLGRLVSTLDRSQLPDLQDLDPERCHLGWSLLLQTSAGVQAIRDVFSFVEDSCELRIVQVERPEATTWNGEERRRTDRRGTAALETFSIRVSTEKVDKLINLVGEVVIAQSMIVQAVTDFTLDKLPLLTAAVAEMERNTRELQERVMAIRMVPIGTTFSRLPRLVHDLAPRFGKQVRLEITGEETELDKGVVERLGDPLTHLIRNAIDHGIEQPDTRAAAGKAPEGVISLRARTESGSVVLEVEDDGRGLDAERIRAKALAREMIRPDDVLSDDQINALVFQPGFSTADTVSDVSGRGVGMDVVRRNIEGLNGTVAISTAKGRGTRFRIRLPLTLAILDGQSLGVGSQTFIIPLVSIVESIRPRAADLRTVGGRGEVVLVRGEPVPLVRLHALFGVTPKVTDPAAGLVVIVEHENHRFGLLVDELLAQSQVVIKNLEQNYRRVEGVMGATILGDGCVALILDVPGLVRLAAGRGEGRRRAETTAA